MPAPRRTSPAQRDATPEFAGIARAIAERRVRLGITQQTLADLAGVSRSSVQSIEYGSTTVKLGAFIDVLDALGMRLMIETRGSG